MKKFLSFILVSSLVLSMSANISMAKIDETGAKEIDFPIDVEAKNSSVSIGEEEYPIKNATILFVNGELLPKVEILLEDDKPLIPIRALSEKLGYKIEWNANERKVMLAKDKSTIELFIGKNTARVDGKDYKMDKSVKIINNTTYIPLSFIDKAMGLNVEDAKKMEGIYPKYYESQMPLSPEKTIVRDMRNIFIDEKHEYMDKSTGEEAMKLIQEKCTEGLRNFEKSMRANLAASKEDPKRFDSVYQDIEREIGRMIFLGEVSKFYKYTIGPYDILFDRTDGKIYFEIYQDGTIIKEMDVNDPGLYSAVFIVG
ncbi:MAG: stalk domain-containing protein [Peptoniphilus lacrimalis]|uniref:stalk domain-containing protein n=1 Tax=Peptoniphilus lacrimalis TaxID=33031 RepID=UPI00254A56AA|nr:stalk domain-containing protein [Peptoniphilus lacrimalis]MDK8282601.1 stalk domain-containing protein [Peptoniphilus lacrimalis]